MRRVGTSATCEADPKARIGILMPDLASRRAQLERDLYSLLSPQQFPITAGAAPALPFEFSLGQPLAQVPLVHAALLLLRWLRQPLTQQEISWLLLSSTLGAAQGDRSARRAGASGCEAAQRHMRAAGDDIGSAAALAAQSGAPAAQRAVSRSGGDARKSIAAPRVAPRPANGCAASAICCAWRGGASAPTRPACCFRLARHGTGCSTAWPRSISRMNLSLRGSFLNTLERTAQETIFAPESQDAPVQVMGVYAASGQSFDAVWFLGATDSGWPASGRPNPLLPIALQRELGMPHTSAADNTALAHRAMERIAESCGEVVYSYAQMSGDAIERPSPLVSSFVAANRCSCTRDAARDSA